MCINLKNDSSLESSFCNIPCIHYTKQNISESLKEESWLTAFNHNIMLQPIGKHVLCPVRSSIASIHSYFYLIIVHSISPLWKANNQRSLISSCVCMCVCIPDYIACVCMCVCVCCTGVGDGHGHHDHPQPPQHIWRRGVWRSQCTQVLLLCHLRLCHRWKVSSTSKSYNF